MSVDYNPFKIETVNFTNNENDDFSYMWSNYRSGGNNYWGSNKTTAFRIASDKIPNGYANIGDIMTKCHAGQSCSINNSTINVLYIKYRNNSNEFSVLPIDYEEVFFSNNEYITAKCWRPIPPEGYISLGLVWNRGTDKPDFDPSICVCVRDDLITYGELVNTNDNIWSLEPGINFILFSYNSRYMTCNATRDEDNRTIRTWEISPESLKKQCCLGIESDICGNYIPNSIYCSVDAEEDENDYFYNFVSELMNNVSRELFNSITTNHSKWTTINTQDSDRLIGNIWAKSFRSFFDPINLYFVNENGIQLVNSPSHEVSNTGRISWTDSSDKYDLFLFNKSDSSGSLTFDNWSKLTPTVMLDSCKLNIEDPYYYDRIGYRSSDGSITTPITLYNPNQDISNKLICSLRLVNDEYDGYCCRISNGEESFDIGFNNGIISSDELKSIGYNEDIEWKIIEIYNQQNNGPLSFKADFEHAPILDGYESAIGTLYRIEWSEGTYMELDSSLIEGFNAPVISSTFGFKLDEEEDSNDQTLLSMGNMGNVYIRGNKLNVYKNSTSENTQCNIDINDNIYYTTGISVSRKDTSELDFALLSNSSFSFPRMNMVDNSSNPPVNRTSLYQWGHADNTKTIYMSELIICVTDSIATDINKMSDMSVDNHNVWNYIYKLRTPDPRCSKVVPQSCQLLPDNPICACYTDNRFLNLAKRLDKNSMVNTDQWCINPRCADIRAYKDDVKFNNSICSSTCFSGLHANTSKYGELNISDVSISNNCQNKSLDNCGDKCDLNSYCKYNNTTKDWSCIPKKSCSLNCSPGYRCYINGNEERCVPERNLINQCFSNEDCNKDETCENNTCIPKENSIVKKYSMSFVIICVLLGIVIVIKNKKIKIISTLAIISIVSYILITNKNETFCVNCNPNDNSCLIGFNNPICENKPLERCNTLNYLPSSNICGRFYYITSVDNVIYAFAEHSSFKYVNGIWQELYKMESQIGFSPFGYIPKINDGKIIHNNISITYKKSIYVICPSNSRLNSSGNTFLIMIYDTYSNRWYKKEIDNFDFNGNGIAIASNNLLYIFSSTSNILVYDMDKEDYQLVELNNNNILNYSKFSKAFLSKDNNIYLVGAFINDNESSIYKFDTDDYSVKIVGTYLPENMNDELNNSGGILTYYKLDGLNEYIYFVDSSLTRINLETDDVDIIPYYTYSNEDEEIRNDLFYELFENIDDYNLAVSMTELNGFKFILNENGDIMRFDDRIMDIVPCLGYSTYGKPIYNRIVNV